MKSSRKQKYPPLLEFTGATVVRNNITALDEINLNINIGENVAIIGPNGSGKSTLIKAITRECYPLVNGTEAPVRILGESIWDVFKLRSMLGIVSGDLQQTCDRDITGRELVLSGFFGSIGIQMYQQIEEYMEDKVREVLDFLEITHLADRYMTNMSSGQARRLLIARALVHEPTALMLDEPGTGLDPHAARKFGNLLRKIASSGKSIILVTHHLQDIIPEIKRVVMIKNGKIFNDGPKEELLTKEHLAELFSMDVEIRKKDGYYYLWA